MDYMRKKNKNKGAMALFLVLILFVIAAMLMISLERMCMPALKQTLKYDEYISARCAALWGQDYARTQIEKNYSWQATGGGVDFSSAPAAYKVTEYSDGQYCVGEINAAPSQAGPSQAGPSQAGRAGSQRFYITFDKMDDGGQAISKYKSYNRILKDDARGSLDTSKDIVYANSVLIISRGVCGNTSVYVEAVYKLRGIAGVDAAVIASNYINIDKSDDLTGIAPKLTVDANDLITPKICSNDDTENPNPSIKSTYADIDFNGGEAVSKGKKILFPNVAKNPDGTPKINGTIVTEKPTEIKSLDIGQVEKKLPADCAKLKAGTYYVAAENVLQYKVGGAVVATYTPDSNGVFPLDGIRMDKTKIYITKPQVVIPGQQMNITENALTITGAANLPSRVKVIMGGENTYILNNKNTDSNISVSGELSGTGSIVSSGAVTFEGKSIMNARVDSGVAVFAEGDVTLNQIPAGANDDEAADSGYRKEFTKLGNEFSGYVYPRVETRTYGNEVLDYNSSKNNLKMQTMQFLNSGDTDFRNKKIQGFKSSAEINNINSNEYNLLRAWLANGFDFEKTDVLFTGLIYTKKNFKSNIDGKFTLIGALIVNSFDPTYGYINFTNAKAINFIYDRKYLGIFEGIYFDCQLDRTSMSVL